MSRLAAVLLLAVAAWPACAQGEKPADASDEKVFRTYAQGGVPVGIFHLRERGGEIVKDRDLLGKISVVQFFYPGCNLCSRNTPTVKKLQDHYRGKADVCLISIDLIDSLKTIDRDVLNKFAQDYEAEPGQWLFLTGPAERVHEVVIGSFYKEAFPKRDPDLGDSIAHRTDLILIDAHGNMVGYADGTDDRAFDALKEQIDALRTRRRLEQRIPITGADLPWFNALLNSTCAILLVMGWVCIRMRLETLHKIAMLSALAVSAVFLASYLFYHFVVMGMEPTRFRGEGIVRYVYFGILLSHTILAIVVAPLAIFITVQGLRNSLALHARVARWTLPIWLYVSVTGVVVYWMLYRMPHAGPP